MPLLPWFLLLVAPLQGRVHVVDQAGGPGSDFTSIGAAVSAAMSGDVVLVREGRFGRDDFFDFIVNGKSLTVVAELGASVVTPDVAVVNLPLGGSVLVQGLTFEVQGLTGVLLDSQGELWLERCRFHPLLFVNDFEGPRISNCASVVMTRCEVDAPLMVHGIRATRSNVHLYQSVVRGGTGVRLFDGFLALSGSLVQGAHGANGSIFFPNGGPGGDGLVLQNGSEALLHDSQLLGGPGGFPFGPGTPGMTGTPLVVVDGVVRDLSGTSKTLELSSPVREGSPFTLTVRGKPGDLVWLAWGTEPLPAFPSPLLPVGARLPRAFAGRFFRAIPPDGVFTATFPALHLAPMREGQTFFAQAIVMDAESGRLVVASPSALVVLDERILPSSGFAGGTTVLQGPGFDPEEVTALEIELGGSGALDNLRWDPRPGR